MSKHLDPSIFDFPSPQNFHLPETQACHSLEVLIALALVSVAFLALSNLSTVAVKGTAAGKKLTIGTMLAQEKLEDLRNGGYEPFQARKRHARGRLWFISWLSDFQTDDDIKAQCSGTAYANSDCHGALGSRSPFGGCFHDFK